MLKLVFYLLILEIELFILTGKPLFFRFPESFLILIFEHVLVSLSPEFLNLVVTVAGNFFLILSLVKGLLQLKLQIFDLGCINCGLTIQLPK